MPKGVAHATTVADLPVQNASAAFNTNPIWSMVQRLTGQGN